MNRSRLAVDKGEGTVKKAKCGLEKSSGALTYVEFAESLGGSDYLNCWRPAFKWVGLPDGEDE